MRLKASGKNAERILIHRFTSVLISMMTNQGNGSAADASYNDEKTFAFREQSGPSSIVKQLLFKGAFDRIPVEQG